MNMLYQVSDAPVRSGVSNPGLPFLPPGLERHPVPGCGSRAIEIFKGDVITISNPEGQQAAELVMFAPDGRSDAEMLGASSSGRPEGLWSLLASGEPSAERVAHALKATGFDLDHADGIRFFDQTTPAGAQEELTAQSDGLLIVCAPGTPMRPEDQTPPTEIVAFVKRINPVPKKRGLKPPAPLADPVIDFNLGPGVARGYEVKAGQYIQVLDVQGRECSDFQAFSRRELDQGIEREIDSTATRGMVGMSYPIPGLFAKFYSTDFEPLVEVIQDTCGRHDTFGPACTARYYEDMGYPGHINCTDNMNEDLARFDIRPRRSWPAINFFFNTMIDDTHAIVSDDPWSRPGDYVLMRAQTDLVCVSTACPSDIGAANAWDPSDIQIRVYDAKEDFKRSIGYRMSVDSDVQATRQGGFYDSFAKHTRDFVEVGGYWLPNQMTNHGAIEEYWACREKAIVMDLTSLKKYEVLGPDAEKLMQHCLTRNMKKLSVGQVVYSAMCYDHGGMIDDGTAFRMDPHNFRWIGGNDTSGLWLREQAEKLGLNAWVKNATSQLCNIAVQGPKSREILSSITWTAPAQPTLDELGWFRFTIARFDDFHGIPVIISRTGFTGELGYEVFCHPKDASAVFDKVMAAGEPFGMIPAGFAALDMLRIEAGLVLAGNEFCDQTDPFEAGIGFTVPLKSKEDDFVGREALVRRKASPMKKAVGLEIEGGVVPNTGDCIRIGRAQVGEVTSAVKSPILGKVIALARMDVTHADEGTSVEVGQLDGHQKRIKAVVCRAPHFDPTKERVKGHY